MINIHYDFQYDENQLIITMIVSRKDTKKLIIELPNKYASITNLHKNIKILESNVNFNNERAYSNKKEIIVRYTFKKYYDSTHPNVNKRFNVIKNGTFLFLNVMNGLAVVYNMEDNVKIKFSTNYDMLISSIGLLKKNKSVTKVFDQNYRRLFFVFSNNYYKSKHIYIGYYDKSKMFIDLKKLIHKLNKLIDTCDKFFNIKSKQIYVISYQDFIGKQKESYGSGYYYGFEYTNSYPKKPIDNIA